MKKLFVTAGMMAIGAAAMQSALADEAGPKYWSAGATLRGFYDDNYNIGNASKGSFGTEVLPTVSAHLPLGQTDIGVRYTYGLYYYENRDEVGVTPIDQTHQVNLWIDHAFTERWHSRLSDTFASGQEPELMNPNPTAANATPYRVSGDNISNHGTAVVDTEWTRLFGTTLTYNNGYYGYQNSGARYYAARPSFYPVPPAIYTPGIYYPGSRNQAIAGNTLAGALNRDEESVALDLKWTVLPDTIAFVGYSLGWVNYTGGEAIAVAKVKGKSVVYTSSDRDNVSHTGYLGLQHEFSPNLTATVKGGASYVDNYANSVDATTSWTPYADLSLTYTYLPGSYAQLGFTQSEGASDQVTADTSGHITEYTENSVVYLNVNHRITSKLSGSVIGRAQYTSYQDGAASSQTTTDYGVGLNLNYQINTHFSVDTGYNFDDVESDLGGYAYTRNRVYLGLTATY